MSDSVLPSHDRARSHVAMATAALCFAALATPVFAQQAGPPRSGESLGMRYLSWSGKPAGPTAPDGLRRPDGMAMAPAQPNGLTPAVRYPGMQNTAVGVSRPSRYGPGSGSHSLTPASAWTAPASMAPTPMSAPAQMYAPSPSMPMARSAPPTAAYQAQQPQQQPMISGPNPAQAQADAQSQADYQARMQAQYQAWYQSEAQRQYQAQVQAMPQYREQQVTTEQAPPLQVRADAGPMPAAPSLGAPPANAAADPMAPRRDAAIFRMQQQDAAAQTQASAQPEAKTAGDEIGAPVLAQPANGRTYAGRAYAGAEPPREGPRYYSVHRADGHQPDPITMPESVYLDGASVDLAEPPATPVQTRTANGRVQTVVPNSDPSLP